jgi:hypothetical protein
MRRYRRSGSRFLMLMLSHPSNSPTPFVATLLPLPHLHGLLPPPHCTVSTRDPCPRLERSWASHQGDHHDLLLPHAIRMLARRLPVPHQVQGRVHDPIRRRHRSVTFFSFGRYHCDSFEMMDCKRKACVCGVKCCSSRLYHDVGKVMPV